MEAQIIDPNNLVFVPVEVPMAKGAAATVIGLTTLAAIVGVVTAYFIGKDVGAYDERQLLRPGRELSERRMQELQDKVHKLQSEISNKRHTHTDVAQ